MPAAGGGILIAFPRADGSSESCQAGQRRSQRRQVFEFEQGNLDGMNIATIKGFGLVTTAN
jgi:hypothetical protein